MFISLLDIDTHNLIYSNVICIIEHLFCLVYAVFYAIEYPATSEYLCTHSIFCSRK